MFELFLLNRSKILAAPFFAITFFFGMGVLEDKRMSGDIFAKFLYDLEKIR